MTVPNLTQAPFAAPSALITQRTAGKPGTPGEARRYGMSMWFEVVVAKPAGEENLGRWSACSNLGVDLEVQEVWSGGENDAPYYLPTAIKYGRVTLERAMEPLTSMGVQQWLRRVAREWHDSPVGGAALTEAGGQPSGYTGTTVTISLFSALGDPGSDRLVAKWVLTGAFPVAWSAPSMASKSGDIAVEKLTLVHRGFLNEESTGRGEPARTDDGRGAFTIAYGTDVLEFQYNPGEVTLEKTLDVDDSRIIQAPTSGLTEFNKLNVSITEVTIEGVAAVRDKSGKLWSWIEPEPIGGAAGRDEPDRAEPKRLTITVGSGKDQTVIDSVCLRSVKVKYTRFTRAGVPCRAVVTLGIVVVPKPEAGQGAGAGAPGAGAGTPHVMTGGQSLPQAAASTPQAGDWRSAADRNGVDDPMRVPSGQSVRL